MKKRILYYLFILLLFPHNGTGQTVARMSDRPVNTSQWITTHFARGVVPPFSFEYGGKPSQEFIKSWSYTATRQKSDDPKVLKYLYTYREPSGGLKVECEVKGFTDFNTVEWVLRFTNQGKKNTPEIANVKVSDITFRYQHPGAFNLHHSEGSHASKSDFSQQLTILSPGDNLYMRPEGGRSSQMRMPFFNIESPANQGVIVAIGWTGTWFADVRCADQQSVALTSGIERLKTYLYPEESIRTSSVCLSFWNGSDRMKGHNQFRRFVQAHHTWKVGGKPTVYPISTSFNYGDPTPCNEYTCLTTDYAIAMVKRYEQFKLVPEVFWLDAGWYNHSADVANHKNWANTVGNWTVDSIRFPEGLRPIADEVHRVGSKFMVWFEPERVMKGSAWALQHPQWMLDARGKAKQEDWTRDGEHDSYLFNLGNPEACRWMSKYIGDFLEENGIDYYRQDFNIEPEGFWAANDEPGRQGICEIRYIEGLYSFWEYLLNRFPGLLVDNCASGGRRIDLESISRSAPMWRTDYSYGEPIGYQCHTYGLNLYLPLHGTGTVSADKFTFRSSLGTSIIYNWKITEAGQSIYDMRDRQAEFKELRPYFYEDYYPLSGINNITSENIWLAYQLYRPSDDSGYIVAFRRKDNPDKSYTVNLSGLHPDHTYILTNKDTGEAIKKTGKELANGFTLTLDNPQSSLIIKYQSSTTAIQKLSVGKKTGVKLRAIGAELDPHFLSQNVTRNDGAKAEDWERIVVKRVKEMGLQSLRVMVMPQWYEPKNDNPDASKIDWHNFTFNSVEMQSLYKVLDMAQEQKMEVTLVLWGAPPGHFLAEGNYGNWVVAPTNYEEWSENFSALVQHLLNNKKYTCVKEITPINEPDWSYIIKGKAAPTANYIEMCKVLDRRFKEDGIRNKVHFSLSDNSDGGTGTHKYLAACTKGLANVADVFNSHTYIFGYETPNSTILDWEKQNSQLAASVGKSHFIGEFGGNQCVGATRQKDIDLYERGVLMTRIAINLLNAGASGVSYWSLIDQYYGKDADYGAMQQLGLWKYVKKTYASEPYYNDIKSDYEVRPQYYAYSLLTRFIRPGAEIYPIATPEEWYAGTAVRNTNGKWVYVFANGMDQEKAISLINQHTQTKGNYQVYRYIKDGLPTTDQMLAPDAQPLKVNDKILCLLPAHSVIVLKQE